VQLSRVLPFALGALATAGALGAACGACSDGVAPDDGGADAARDVRADRDAAVVPPTDAPPDSFVAGFTEGWTRVPWSEPTCGFYQPGSPAVLAQVPPLAWKPCASGRPGCEALQHDWNKPTSSVGIAASWVAAGHVHLLLQRSYGGYQAEWVLWREDQGIVGAWRQNGNDACLAVSGPAQGEGVVFAQNVRRAPNDVAQYRIGIGDVPALAAPQPTHVIDASALPTANTLLVLTSSSPTWLAMWLDSTGSILVYERDGGAIHLMKDDAGGYSSPEAATIAGDGVFFNALEPYAWTKAAGARRLVTTVPGVFAHSLATDGTTMVWLESTDYRNGAYQSVAVKSAPHTTEPSALVPSLRAQTGCGSLICGTIVSEGWASWGGPRRSLNQFAIEVLRLSDGARWSLEPASGERLAPGKALQGKIYYPHVDLNTSTNGIQRLDVSALGAPETD
jgi:hypothetical protein